MDVKKMVQDFDPKEVGKLKKFKWIADYVVLAGGVLWLLYGIGLNLLGGFLGRVVAILIGLSAALLCYFIYEEKFMKKGAAAEVKSADSKPEENKSDSDNTPPSA